MKPFPIFPLLLLDLIALGAARRPSWVLKGIAPPTRLPPGNSAFPRGFVNPWPAGLGGFRPYDNFPTPVPRIAFSKGFVNPWPAGLGGFRPYDRFLTPIPKSSQREIRVVNNCSFPVWFDYSGFPTISKKSGSVLNSGVSTSVFVHKTWQGMIWPRTECHEIANCSSGSCEHGGKCTGLEMEAVISSAHFLFFGHRLLEMYYVYMKSGYSIPVLIEPHHSKQSCRRAGECLRDVNEFCPEALAVKKNGTTVACRSGCDVFKTDEECCRGEFRDRCGHSGAAKMFREACPNSWTQGRNIRFSCVGAQYSVQFC